MHCWALKCLSFTVYYTAQCLLLPCASEANILIPTTLRRHFTSRFSLLCWRFGSTVCMTNRIEYICHFCLSQTIKTASMARAAHRVACTYTQACTLKHAHSHCNFKSKECTLRNLQSNTDIPIKLLCTLVCASHSDRPTVYAVDCVYCVCRGGGVWVRLSDTNKTPTGCSSPSCQCEVRGDRSLERPLWVNHP